jgi:hypothetical protein
MRIQVITLLLVTALSPAAFAQQRSPTDTMRDFYRMMRDKKFREAFDISIYRPAIDGLSSQEYEEPATRFREDGGRSQRKDPGESRHHRRTDQRRYATVFVKVIDADGKERIEPATLIKIDNAWVVGDKESLTMVKQAGKKFFFEARINAHHSDVQDMLTRISLAQVVYSQGHNGLFGNTAELITAGLIPKDIEGIESTGYRFQLYVLPMASRGTPPPSPRSMATRAVFLSISTLPACEMGTPAANRS